MRVSSPVVVLGFGRSGTTWVADIISKASGQLLLFEPFHPAVCPFSKNICYKSNFDSILAAKHWETVSTKNIRNRWLLRNHLNSPLEGLSSEFIEYVWNESKILGFKSIRINHNIHWVSKYLHARVVFIIRHPLAVVSSLLNRPSFWEEYGWAFHWETFVENTIQFHPVLEDIRSELLSIMESIHERYEQFIFMWCITHMISLQSLAELNIQPFFYDDLYKNPFEVGRSILKNIGLEDLSLHPAHLFTPSMVSLRTVHDIHMETKPSFFWEKTLSGNETLTALRLLKELSLLNDNLHALCASQGFFDTSV